MSSTRPKGSTSKKVAANVAVASAARKAVANHTIPTRSHASSTAARRTHAPAVGTKKPPPPSSTAKAPPTPKRRAVPRSAEVTSECEEIYYDSIDGLSRATRPTRAVAEATKKGPPPAPPKPSPSQVSKPPAKTCHPVSLPDEYQGYWKDASLPWRTRPPRSKYVMIAPEDADFHPNWKCRICGEWIIPTTKQEREAEERTPGSAAPQWDGHDHLRLCKSTFENHSDLYHPQEPFILHSSKKKKGRGKESDEANGFDLASFALQRTDRLRWADGEPFNIANLRSFLGRRFTLALTYVTTRFADYKRSKKVELRKPGSTEASAGKKNLHSDRAFTNDQQGDLASRHKKPKREVGTKKVTQHDEQEKQLAYNLLKAYAGAYIRSIEESIFLTLHHYPAEMTRFLRALPPKRTENLLELLFADCSSIYSEHGGHFIHPEFLPAKPPEYLVSMDYDMAAKACERALRGGNFSVCQGFTDRSGGGPYQYLQPELDYLTANPEPAVVKENEGKKKKRRMKKQAPEGDLDNLNSEPGPERADKKVKIKSDRKRVQTPQMAYI